LAPTDRGDPRISYEYAAQLVSHIKRFNDSGSHPDRQGFGIGVAGFPEGHPETPNRLVEMDRLKAKVDAGADGSQLNSGTMAMRFEPRRYA
jgi:5,10-methylenetetrahydrofolate reductase